MGDTKNGREKKGLIKQAQRRDAEIRRELETESVVDDDEAEKYLEPDEEDLELDL